MRSRSLAGQQPPPAHAARLTMAGCVKTCKMEPNTMLQTRSPFRTLGGQQRDTYRCQLIVRANPRTPWTFGTPAQAATSVGQPWAPRVYLIGAIKSQTFNPDRWTSLVVIIHLFAKDLPPRIANSGRDGRKASKGKIVRWHARDSSFLIKSERFDASDYAARCWASQTLMTMND